MISEKEYAIIKGCTAKKVHPLTFCERIFKMKRLIALILCVGLLAVTAAGCGGSQKKKVATGDEAVSTDAASYDNNFKGLCTYFSALGYINPLEDNKGVTYSVMSADIIGAKEGRRFVGQGDLKNTVIELYEYDLAALQSTPDEAATEVRASVQKDNTFVNLVGKTVEDAYLSDNGRFLMIISGKNDHKEEVIKNFKSFHANEK